MMALERLPHAGLRAGHEPMPGDFLQSDRVDDDFALGDAHRQHLADVRPGHGVKVEPMGDVAFDVDVAIDDLGRVEVAGRQRQQVRLFALDDARSGDSLKSRRTRTSATFASHQAVTSLRCSSVSKVRPLSKLVST